MRNKTIRMANNLGDRFRKGKVRKFEAPFFFFSKEANVHSVSVCVHNFFPQSDTRNFMKKATVSDGGKGDDRSSQEIEKLYIQ